MSEISNTIHCNELKTMDKNELLLVLDSVETRILIEALWNKINRLENLEADMKNLFTR